jgi:hypothetical protein
MWRRAVPSELRSRQAPQAVSPAGGKTSTSIHLTVFSFSVLEAEDVLVIAPRPGLLCMDRLGRYSQLSCRYEP